MNKDKKLELIIEALAEHEDSEAVAVLEKFGTNSQEDEIRMLTAKALIKRNSKDSLDIIVNREGKGINDLSTSVAMSSINYILELENKEKVLELLEEAEKNNQNKSVKDTAKSVKTLISMS